MFLQSCGFVLWLSLPLLVANMVPVLIGRFGVPIDGGRRWRDGQPIFGPGKTWLGFVGGVGLAVLWTFVLIVGALAFGNSTLGDAWGDQFNRSTLRVTALATGALLGDLIASFFKRRRRIRRGDRWPFVDQFDAVIGGLALTALVDWTWFQQAFLSRWLAVVMMCIVYYLGHAVLSRLSFQLGWKSTPN